MAALARAPTPMGITTLVGLSAPDAFTCSSISVKIVE
jgi:hypothetical protein